MTPLKFKGHNVVFAENQPEYIPLPAFKNNSPHGEVVTCWQLSFLERLQILFTGKLWMQMLTFNQPLTPVYLTVKMEDVFTVKEATND